ncbi:hypothetical protein GA0070616_1504 [Micromonospora nigra]|uniref:Uncharacterized protein n=1 Tax=Micromonospora nigra TaxID=145857 RepID=A0A1C6RMS3_9ACTN|nr:hypothetical protein [Micromonospora nigra]SCL18411.1 hypothetical protein GA0070616_1504 [Micromonospora nigra]
MTDRDRQRPLEESPEMAAAVEDETGISELMDGGDADRDTPSFVGPEDEVIGDPYAAGTGATGTGTGTGTVRTGAEQPWEPEDLVLARGQDLTPQNLERARRDLAELGRAAIEKTVP